MLHDLAQRGVDQLLGAGVDRRRGVVEHEHAGVGEHGTSDGDALALATGEGEAALADDGVVGVGERLDEDRGTRDLGGAPDVVVGGVGAPVCDVVAHRIGEQERVLEHDADFAAK